MKRTYIIAEAGVNHNGSLDIAMALVKAASNAGADAVKFQTFKAENLVSVSAPKAEYQKKTTGGTGSQFEMLKKLELSEEFHRALFDQCRVLGIDFLSTPFDFKSVDFLYKEVNLKLLKLSSGEITNAPLLLKVAKTAKPVIVSTGMSTLADIEAALGVLAFGYLGCDDNPTEMNFRNAFCSSMGQDVLREKVTLLHCTTEYPSPMDEVNLDAMETLRAAFGLQIGYSDHTEGIAVPIAAVARGAKVIEKHFTLNRTLPGPDHKASIEPDQLREMILSIRSVEAALGSSQKIPSPSEQKNIEIVRKSLVVTSEVLQGELLTEDNLGVKRPGTGISPFKYWDYLGKRAVKDYHQDDLL